jgi:hypothetical protein
LSQGTPDPGGRATDHDGFTTERVLDYFHEVSSTAMMIWLMILVVM